VDEYSNHSNTMRQQYHPRRSENFKIFEVVAALGYLECNAN